MDDHAGSEVFSLFYLYKMETNEKGCVYFFRHIGLTPVKIGYSTHESPIGRFEQFKTYAPYGSEIIGFIRTYEAKELETILHERFSAFRLGGEWFEISKEQCESVISFYSNIEDIKEKNEFEIEWAKKVRLKSDLINKKNEPNFMYLETINNWFNYKYNIGDKITNFEFLNIFNELKAKKLKINSYKKLLRQYLSKSNYKIDEYSSNGYRYFIIN